MAAFARAAYIVSARHLQGSVVCKAADALPFVLRVGQTAHFVPPTLKGPRTARVASIDEMPTGDSWEVHFEGIDSIDAAEGLAGSYCLVAENELPEISLDEHVRMLVGFGVQDVEFGLLGEVVAVQENPAQVLLEIEGERAGVLIPFVDEFVVSVDEDARVVHTAIPLSLLELNATVQDEDLGAQE